MGADIRKLRNRIKSTDSTLHLTKAMGLVASSKIRRATEAMNKSRDYEKAVGNTVDALITSPECRKSPYILKRGSDNTCLLVVAGDRGLAGGYNANIFRLMRNFSPKRIIPIGKRACDRYGGKVRYAEPFSYNDAIKLSMSLCRDFENGKFDKLGIVCTKYISMMTQEAQIKWILPINRTVAKKNNGVIFEPDEISVFNAVIPEYVAGVILSSVRESFASEVAARRCAMDSAGKNARKMIDDLRLSYNRARQGTITQEITEIVAGSGR